VIRRSRVARTGDVKLTFTLQADGVDHEGSVVTT
jgi:hypothetical protein